MLDPPSARAGAGRETENDTETRPTGPDSTQLTRRGALVPPKIDDPMDAVDDPDGPEDLGPEGHHGAEITNGDCVAEMSPTSRTFPAPRRSSVVVIPPMQVCPGDLLVYSKALTHRGNFPGKISYIYLF